ncbi:MAG: methylase, partial [Selenomonadaceae bacterium]|nr:methylase [Selenomonadaceae bacterium]
MVYGSKPTDNGKLILSPDERDELIAKNPTAAKWIRRYVGSREFIHRLPRYCLWLVDCPPNELRRMPLVYQRVQAVRDFRLASKKAATRRDAATPWLFQERRQPTTNYLLVPSVSGERREYVPMDYVSADVICSNANLMVPGAMYWHFGVLTSRPHMAWMRATCGRLKSDYRYSADIVYNNFPWPPFNREVELTAAEILFARTKYPDASFADLYDPLIMPKDLRKAHEANDRAVLEAYDLPLNIPEEQLQKELFKMYKSLRDFDEFYQSL